MNSWWAVAAAKGSGKCATDGVEYGMARAPTVPG